MNCGEICGSASNRWKLVDCPHGKRKSFSLIEMKKKVRCQSGFGHGFTHESLAMAQRGKTACQMSLRLLLGWGLIACSNP